MIERPAPISSPPLRRASGRRRDRDVRNRALDRLARPPTSTTSSTPRRSSCSTGTNPFPGPARRSRYGQNLIWPPVAAFLVAPFTILSPGGGRLGGRARRARVLHGARCGSSASATGGSTASFALWPSVIGEIRVSHLTPFLCLLARARLALPRRALRARARARPRRRDQVLPLAARRLARRDRPGARGARRRGASRRASLLLVLPFTSLDDYVQRARRARDGRSTRTATRRSASSCSSARPSARARRDARARRGAPRRLLAPGEPRARGRRRARALADRLARLLRRRGDPARDRPAAALARSGSPRSRRGAC